MATNPIKKVTDYITRTAQRVRRVIGVKVLVITALLLCVSALGVFAGTYFLASVDKKLSSVLELQQKGNYSAAQGAIDSTRAWALLPHHKQSLDQAQEANSAYIGYEALNASIVVEELKTKEQKSEASAQLMTIPDNYPGIADVRSKLVQLIDKQAPGSPTAPKKYVAKSSTQASTTTVTSVPETSEIDIALNNQLVRIFNDIQTLCVENADEGIRSYLDEDRNDHEYYFDIADSHCAALQQRASQLKVDYILTDSYVEAVTHLELAAYYYRLAIEEYLDSDEDLPTLSNAEAAGEQMIMVYSFFLDKGL